MKDENSLNTARANLVRNALALCGYMAWDKDIRGVLSDLEDRYGCDFESGERIVSALNAEYFASYFRRKKDEENREQFKDELAARVWDTVKGMTWFTDAQKVIPEDLVARVDQKRIDEENHLNDLRDGLFR